MKRKSSMLQSMGHRVIKSQMECFLSLFHTEYAFVELGVALQR